MLKYDREQVMRIIPQRDPILLIDSVEELDPGNSITATFFVKPDFAWRLYGRIRCSGHKSFVFVAGSIQRKAAAFLRH